MSEEQAVNANAEAEARERMVPQSEVDKLVVATKREAVERYQRELEKTRGAEKAQPEFGGMPVVDTAKIREEVLNDLRSEMEERQRAYEQEQNVARAKQFVADFEAKLEAGKSRYEDFDQVMADFDPKEFIDVVLLANDVEGTADVMYELAKNPNKLAQVASMTDKSKAQAKRMMQQLASSIKQNHEAVDSHRSNGKPLPKLTPSTAGTSNSSSMTLADFKRIYKG